MSTPKLEQQARDLLPALGLAHIPYYVVPVIAAALAAAYHQGREDQRKESEPIPQSYQEFLAKFYPSGI